MPSASLTPPELTVDDDAGLLDTLGYVSHLYSDRCETVLTIDERHINRGGVVHGGVYATIMDTAAGFAASKAWSKDASQPIVTLSLTTNYLDVVREGTLRAIARIEKAGGSIAYVAAETRSEDGRLIATAKGVFKRMRQRPSERLDNADKHQK